VVVPKNLQFGGWAGMEVFLFFIFHMEVIMAKLWETTQPTSSVV